MEGGGGARKERAGEGPPAPRRRRRLTLRFADVHHPLDVRQGHQLHVLVGLEGARGGLQAGG